MADVISRAFKDGKFFTATNNLLTYFDTHFPLPQKKSWQECHLPDALVSRVISCLRGELLPMALLQRLPLIEKNTGSIGKTTQPSCSATPTSLMSLKSNATSSLEGSLRGSGQASTAEDIQSKFKESLTPSRPSPRPSNWLENKVRSTATKKRTTSLSRE